MILALDNGTESLGWAIVDPQTCGVEDLGVLHQPHDSELDLETSRALRWRRQGAELHALVNEHRITAIAGETLSTGGPPKARFAMGVSLAGSWGVACAIAAVLGLELYAVPPKLWQQEITGVAGKVDYEALFKAVCAYLKHGAVWQAFNAIAKRHRNHAVDAVSVGIFTALRPELATRIGGP